jgi:hypothetical protein
MKRPFLEHSSNSFAACLGLLVLFTLWLAGCSSETASHPITPYEGDQLPTIVALTVAAQELAETETVSNSQPSTQPLELESASAVPERAPEIEQVNPEGGSTSSAPIEEDESPASTPHNAAPSETPPPVPLRTLTPAPTLPVASIQITRPGPASRVVSPLRVSASLIPGANGTVKMELFGEDGRLLVRKILTYTANPGARVLAISNMDFEIAAVAEAGRLVISTEDTNGRIISLTSVDLVLLSLGEEDLNPSGTQFEPIVIQEPARNILIQGGTVLVSGLAKPRGQDTLLVQLLTADGKQLGPARLAEVEPSTGDGHGFFSAEISYSVTAPTWVRVTVSERVFEITEIVHLSSVEVLLSP